MPSQAQQRRLLERWFSAGEAKLVTRGEFTRGLATVHFSASESEFLWTYYRKSSHLNDTEQLHMAQVVTEIFDVRA